VKRIVVLGLGVYGMQLLRTLARLGAEVCAIDEDRRKIESVKSLVHDAVVAKAEDRKALEALRVHEADAVVVCLGDDFEASELCVLHLKELGCKRIIARASTEERADLLEALGPDLVITPTLDEARKMGQILMTPSVEDYARMRGGRSLVIYRAPPFFVGKTLGELRLGSRFKAFIIAIQREVSVSASSADAGMEVRPTPEYVVQEGDLLYILGFDADLLRLASRYA
jgi:trk system potassium uptake protein TrkA